jgi:hypothetical protein
MPTAHKIVTPALYDLPEDFIQEIGRIVVHWAFLEHYVQRIVWLLLKVDAKRGRVAVRDADMERRIDMIADLASIEGAKLETLDSFKSKAKETAGDRNLVVHGLWMKDDDGTWSVQDTRGSHPKDVTGLLSRKRSIEPGSVVMDTERLRGITAEIERLIASAKSLQEEVAKLMASRTTFTVETSAASY